MRWLLLAVATTLTACGISENSPAFDGFKYRAQLSKVDKQRDQIAVTVSPVSQSLAGAREAGRYEGTKYCIEQFGTSDIVWANGPDSEEADLIISKDKLELRGACVT